MTKGDSYSLSFPGMWLPADDAKVEKFEREIHKIIDAGKTMAGEGVGMLFKNVADARQPVTYRDVYPGPFYTTGAGIVFRAEQEIGRLELSNKKTPVFEQLVSQIAALRSLKQDDAAMKTDIAELTAQVTAFREVAAQRKLLGMKPQARWLED